MNRFLPLLLSSMLAAMLVSAAAQTPSIQPGEWRVTSKTTLNGAPVPPSTRTRCFTPAQATETTRTFGPQVGAVNSTCGDPVMETTDRTLAWRLECKGQMDMQVQGAFKFDSPTHYTAIVASKAWMGGAQISDALTEVEGERVGDCQQ